MGGRVAADGSNIMYNLQILHQQSSYFTIYEWILWMSSPYSVKHVQVIRNLNFLMDYYFNR